MRLLRTGTTELAEFGGNQVPRYAILSHTWGEEEVTLQHMKTNEAMNLKGYEKVKMACSIAKRDGFEYIWIDTCCIDKTSSAELSEALNSMYHWYEEAKECYAYLADVPRGTADRLTNAVGDRFRKSRWFTRGWTLQELIAPSTVIFLDSEWREIGSKSNLQELISEITRIPGGFLLGDDLGHASVAQRMSWASKRETTRVEDLAYCLMGIFGIYMPMLYGEGERAFIRLQEEIMRVSDDHSLFAWKSTEDHGGILATSPSAFTNSGNIIQKNPSNSVNSPPTPSSRGIRLSLRLRSNDQEGSGLAILHCTEVGKESMRLGIHLKDVFLTNEDFAREQSSKLKLLHLEEIDLSQYPLTDLYVRQWRSTHNRKWGDMEKCAIKLEGVGGEEVPLHTTYLHSNWALYDGMMITTMELPPVGILGRLLVICKDGTSFQVVLKKCGRFLSADIHTSFKAGSKSYQSPIVPEQQQHERDRIARLLDSGQHVHVAIKKRILMFRQKKHLVGVMEISYSSTLLGMWVEHVALLEGDIKEKTLLSYAANQGHEAVVKLLLDTKKVDIDSKDKDGLTPLSEAADNGHESVVKLLLENNAALETKNKNGRTLLSWAAENGQRAVVKLLLSYGADQEAENRDGQRPLALAAANGHGAVVKLLLGHDADREAKNTYNSRTPLAWAAANGHRAVVQLLLSRGAEREDKDWSGRTPLALAAVNGRKATVKLLLKKSADQEAKDRDGQTPLALAAANGHEAVVKLLLGHGADQEAKNKFRRTPLALAAANGHGATVKLLLDQGADQEAKGAFDSRTPLALAAANGHEAVVQLLLNQDTDQEAKGADDSRIPLALAAANGYGAVVQLLLDHGADQEAKDKSGQTPLVLAAANGHRAVVKLLLDQGANQEAKGAYDSQTLLALAAANGHEAIVQLLLDQGADQEAKDTFKSRTPLALAVANGHEAVVKLLLSHGADRETKDKSDRTPLVLAVVRRHGAIVKLLLDQGANQEAKGASDSGTPLALAAAKGYEVIVQLLLDQGADHEAKDTYNSRTPLALATANGHEAIVKLLLSHGADRKAKDTDSQTPLALAVANKHRAIVKLLRRHGNQEAKDRDNRISLQWARRRNARV